MICVCGDKLGGNLPQVEVEDDCEYAQFKMKKKCKGKKR